MSCPRFKARNHPQQTCRRGPVDDVDDRATTPNLFASIVARFGPFTVDPDGTGLELSLRRLIDALAPLAHVSR